MASVTRSATGTEFGADASDETALLERFGVDVAHPAAADPGIETRIERWLCGLIEPELETVAETTARTTAQTGAQTGADAIKRGRIAWLACGGPTRWRDEFLSPTPAPDFVAAFRAALPRVAPEPAPLRMPEQTLRSASPRRGVRGRIGRLFGPDRIAAR